MDKFTLRLIVLALLYPATHAFCQDMNSPIYSEVIPTSSGLPYDPATDTRESFQAPNGKTVEVLVKRPCWLGYLYARDRAREKLRTGIFRRSSPRR